MNVVTAVTVVVLTAMPFVWPRIAQLFGLG